MPEPLPGAACVGLRAFLRGRRLGRVPSDITAIGGRSACAAMLCCAPRCRHASIPSSEFEFDRVLGPGASQSDVYHAAVKPIVEAVLNG